MYDSAYQERRVNLYKAAIKPGADVQIVKITFNDCLGKVAVLKINDTYVINRRSYNRVWKTVSNKLGGLTAIKFDTVNPVEQFKEADYGCLVYELKHKGVLA